MDALQINPYRLNFADQDREPRFIEKEENFFRWAWLAARPRSWYWAPEVYTPSRSQRMLEPRELRMMTYAALGHGAHGINYYTYGSAGDYTGFQDSPPLLAEIKKLNAEIKKLEPMLSVGLPMLIETIGTAENIARLYVLRCGDAGELIIVRNLAYENSRENNDRALKPTFKTRPRDITVIVQLPTWFRLASVFDPLDDAKMPIPHKANGQEISLVFKQVETVKVAWLENRKQK